GILSSTTAATVTLNVTNAAPVANNDSYSVIHDHTLSVNAASGVLANDTDADGDTMTPSAVTGPSHGTLTLNTDGSFTYVPTTLYAGSDNFTHKNNGVLTTATAATVNLTVSDAAPVAQDDSYSVIHDHTLTVNAAAGVLANDTDADGDILTASVVS